MNGRSGKNQHSGKQDGSGVSRLRPNPGSAEGANAAGGSKPEVLFEDNHVLVCIKPPGILSQSDISGDPDQLSIVREYIRIVRNKLGNVYLALLHRLDRSTGGLMVFALTSKAAGRLSEAFKKRLVTKRYLALVPFSLQESLSRLGGLEGELVDVYRKDEKSKMAVACPANHPEAKEARLKFRILNEDTENVAAGFLSNSTDSSSSRAASRQTLSQPGFTVIQIELLTGRFHQIRFQLSKRGLPLCGEAKYADQGLPDFRLGLWAYQLKFPHPIQGQCEFEAMPSAQWWAERLC
ncbi:MAG: RluA family pseudouridine synthase [Leptospiraceae bacterium]|nr:RluA family pseudouridine synthase [Leptospiraceae bacterium]